MDKCKAFSRELKGSHSQTYMHSGNRPAMLPYRSKTQTEKKWLGVEPKLNKMEERRDKIKSPDVSKDRRHQLGNVRIRNQAVIFL